MFGSHSSASTVPSRRITAEAITTGRNGMSSAAAARARSARVTLRPRSGGHGQRRVRLGGARLGVAGERRSLGDLAGGIGAGGTDIAVRAFADLPDFCGCALAYLVGGGVAEFGEFVAGRRRFGC